LDKQILFNQDETAVTSFALLLIGFSVFSAIVLALTHFRCENYQDQPRSRSMGLFLLVTLSALQLVHFVWLYHDVAWIETLPYRMALFAVAPAFFLFSQPLLQSSTVTVSPFKLLAHALPIALSPLLPEPVALPLAFIVGAAYLLWLAHSLYALRAQRAGFLKEMVLLGSVFAIAISVSLLGLMRTALPGKLFFSLYASAIGLAFLLVQLTLALRPKLSTEVSEAVQTSYASTTLSNVDCDASLASLDQLMRQQNLYIDADLSLPGLAERLGLSSHQLSELMNVRLGKGFSRYLRELRVTAAKSMLIEEASASVLSIGLSVGFTSQSNFYEAFREIEGMTPGQFRKIGSKSKTN
jgi:AraC-like DNA-binding protein